MGASLKAALRRRMRAIRRHAMSTGAAEAAAEVLLTHAHVDDSTEPVGLFHPLPNELSTLPLAQWPNADESLPPASRRCTCSSRWAVARTLP